MTQSDFHKKALIQDMRSLIPRSAPDREIVSDRGMSCLIVWKLEQLLLDFNPDDFNIENRFALQTVKALLASILRKYKITSLVPLDRVELAIGTTMGPKNKITLKMEIRE